MSHNEPHFSRSRSGRSKRSDIRPGPPRSLAIQPPTTSPRAVEKKYTRKRAIALTPWRREALPGCSMGNILNQHVEHQAPLPTLTPNRPSTRHQKNTLEKAPSPSPLGFMKLFPGPQTPAPCTTTYATLHDGTPAQSRSVERPLVLRRSHEFRGRAPTCYTTKPTNEPGESRLALNHDLQPIPERRATFSPAPKARDPRASPDLLHD